MNAELALLGLSAIVVAALACLFSKRKGIRVFGGVLVGLLSLACSWVAVFLFQVGAKNNWTSDGPAMLFIIIGIGASGLLAFFGWALVLSTFAGHSKASTDG